MIRTGSDEMYDADGQVRSHYRAFARWLVEIPDELPAQRRREADLKLAVGLDYLDACPLRGMRRGGGYEQMHEKVLATPAPVITAQQQ